MLVEKSYRARIENYSRIFFQLGLILSLILVLISIEWKSLDRYVGELNAINIQDEIVEDIPMTERIIEKKPPPPPPPAPERIEIVADHQEIIESVLESTETDESEVIEIIEIEEIVEIEEEEVVENIPFAIIEEVPVYPGCKGTNAQKKKCFSKKVQEYIGNNFNTGLVGDLGLSKGTRRVYCQFKIDKNGNVIDVRARGPHKRLEKEAIRVVQKLPKMTPGKQRGRPVGVNYTLPITLIVE